MENPSSATDDIILRRLQPSDHTKGFLELLNQLSPSPPLSPSSFTSIFNDVAALADDHLILVAEHTPSARVLATGTLLIERKFLRGGGKVGHLEDVVVDASARGGHLGQRIVRELTEYAKEKGCYKVILDCTAELKGYYEKCGYAEKNIQMAKYF